MAPQTPKLNRGQWQQLEAKAREWMSPREELWIITGPAFDPAVPAKTIGDGVAVPTHFYKVLYDKKPDGNWTGVAFLLPNNDLVPRFDTTVCTIDAIELAVGADFFPTLTEEQAIRAESAVSATDWWASPAVRATPTQSQLPRFNTASSSYPTPTPVPVLAAPRTGTVAPSGSSSDTVYHVGEGKKYHRAGCRYLSRGGTVSQHSLASARSAGWEACSVCNP